MIIEKKNDLYIVFFAFRYALGRKTAAPSIAIGTIKEVWDSFPIQDKEQLLYETSQYCDRELGRTVSVGDWEIDNEWYQFKSWLAEKIREDKIDDVIKDLS